MTQDSYDVALGIPHSILADTAIYHRVAAFDFDDTIADNRNVPPEVEPALDHCRNNGHRLDPVTEHPFHQGEEPLAALNQVVPNVYEELRQLR